MTQTITRAVSVLIGLLLLMMIPVVCGGQADTDNTSLRDRLIARADSLELDTEYVAPPGDALEHHPSGFAKILCSAVFITGLDPEFAAENVGFFTSPYAERAKVIERVIDRENQTVHLMLPNGVTRTAKLFGDQGCVKAFAAT